MSAPTRAGLLPTAGRHATPAADTIVAHSRRQNETARTLTCPADRLPRGVLFNHVSKTGGTSMDALLRGLSQAMGLPFLFATPMRSSAAGGRSQPTASALLGGKRGVVMMRDDWHFTVTDELREHFFVLGTVRPPCDWEVSSWAYRSGLQASAVNAQRIKKNPGLTFDHSLYGQVPPYNGTQDRRRFAAWLRSQDAVAADSLERSIQRRYGGVSKTSLPHAAHCWMRTTALIQDLAACLEQYASCGGERLNVSLWLRAHEKLRANPSARADCDEYFRDEADVKLVMRRNPSFGDPQKSAFGFDGASGAGRGAGGGGGGGGSSCCRWP